MKKRVFLFLTLLAGVLLLTLPLYRNALVQALSYNPCDTLILYKVGSVDTKFDLSRQEVQQDIAQATGLWSSAYGKPLFAESNTAALTVNFVYDSRAALRTQVDTLQSQLSQNDTSLQKQIDSYTEQVDAFKQKLAAFNAEVDSYNRKGGAPQAVYDQLIQEQQQLNAEGDQLNQLAKQLNLSTNQYNYNVSVFNGDVTQLQNALAQKPEEGLYDGAKDTITIYFANNKKELIHTLSHEFGHALGMGHVKNPKALMYPYSTEYLQVAADDLQDLKSVCKSDLVFTHNIQTLLLWIGNVITQASKK